MNEGLEALSKIKSDHEIILFGFSTCDYEYAKEFDIIEKALKEHEQYKAIEEELDIDIVTLFKALKDGFYIKYNGEIVHIFPDKHITINFWYKIINVFIPPKFFIDCKKGTNYLSETIDEEYWFKDYGKTWALTKEELL